MYNIQQFVLFTQRKHLINSLVSQNLTLFRVGEVPGMRACSCFGLVLIIISGTLLRVLDKYSPNSELTGQHLDTNCGLCQTLLWVEFHPLSPDYGE